MVLPSGASCDRDYETKQEAMDQWDKSCDNVLPGDKLTLTDMDTNRLLSQYSPVGRSNI